MADWGGSGAGLEVAYASGIERIPTGIPGLDERIGGGLPSPSMILVAGDIGTGKTTFCSQFLCKGAEIGERGLYFMIFGGPPRWAVRFISTFEFVCPEYFERELKYIDLGEASERARTADEALEPIRAEILRFHPKRVVIDTPTVLEDILKDDYRRFLLKLSVLVKEQGIVAAITGESGPGEPYPAGIAHIADGVILLHNTEVNHVRMRSIEILKMRGTPHISGKHAVDISSKGLTIYPGM